MMGPKGLRKASEVGRGRREGDRSERIVVSMNVCCVHV